MNVVAPSGVVTFLFTDIEGSTRRWEADPNTMRAALAAHDALLNDTVLAHDGYLFKHTGDGICAAFSSPKAAVDAAVAAQRELALPVRMGIATGEAERRGDDYFGAVLNRAARVMAAGHGGQILIDGATAELVTGVELHGLGTHRLRDIARAVNVFQVRADDLRTSFPPIRTLDPAPGNLRPPATSLIGREAELAEVLSILKAHRLVTLTGVGGVGKTRLALEVAARAAHDFPDGVFVVEFASVGDPAAVPEAVAAVLGIKQQPGFSVAESVAAGLENRSRLLVFDNCEHVLDAAADMAEAILTRSTTVTLLATSREGLRLADERLWPVPALDVRAGVQSSAATLFVGRAQAVAPTFSLTADDADAVVEICRRLDGIPLAIELAAARLVSMTVGEVKDRLDDRLRLLVGSRRGLERHQTLRQAVQWSYDLLSDDEKFVLRRCSVFAGGFDLAAAHRIAGGNDDFATLDLLDALVRKSLLMANRSGGRTRYSMLETIRGFAEEQLAVTGDAGQVRAAHARYFAEQEIPILSLWDGPRQREAYTWLATEMPNLRVAFRWAADNGDLDAAAGIAYYAAFLGFWGDQHEPIRWAEELIGPARDLRHPRLAQLYGIASLCYTAGRVQEAIAYASAGQEAIRSGAFQELPPELEPALGSPYIAIGEPQRWAQWCREVIARRRTAHPSPQALLAMALTFSGAEDEAIAAAGSLLAAADATDNPNLAAWLLFAYGTTFRTADPASAYDALRRGLMIAQRSGSRQTESGIASVLSNLAVTQGSTDDAFDLLVLSMRYYYDSGSWIVLNNPLISLAVLLEQLGRYEPAATIGGHAATPFTLGAFPEVDTTIARLRHELGDELYESLANRGRQMPTAVMTEYAFDQIDQARAALTNCEPDDANR
ncbi:cyclase [Mycobacteriaceae bacterium 1482268.1]|nr:cyclase [Mycobacteriaceae bacterium 1482268.1]